MHNPNSPFGDNWSGINTLEFVFIMIFKKHFKNGHRNIHHTWTIEGYSNEDISSVITLTKVAYILNIYMCT